MDSKQALSELQNFNKNRTGAADYYTQSAQGLGVNAAQQRANDLRGLIRNTESALKGVDASVRGRTQGSLVTSAQQARLAALEREPLAQELSGHQNSYSDEMANYRDLMGQAQTQAGLRYQSDSDKANSLQKVYENLFGQEQAEKEYQARMKQIADEDRRWREQFEYQKQQDAIKNRLSRESAWKPTFTPPTAPTSNFDALLKEAMKRSSGSQPKGLMTKPENLKGYQPKGFGDYKGESGWRGTVLRVGDWVNPFR